MLDTARSSRPVFRPFNNARFAELLGYAQADLIGRSYLNFVVDDDVARRRAKAPATEPCWHMRRAWKTMPARFMRPR
jgi:hypothetical protein